ncbi:MAG: DUF3501 family protein [Anaeromyxobacteraceae bacterium]
METYNELVGGKGELGCSLLIEITDPEERAKKLGQWLALPKHLYVKTEDGEKHRARFDERQIGTDRLSSVQYLRFDVKGRQAHRGRQRPARPHRRDGARRRAARGAAAGPRERRLGGPLKDHRRSAGAGPSVR